MRNLKKVLALVLSLVMALSMVTIASAQVPGTAYTDDSAIIGQYDEAVQVLDALNIFQGRDDGSLDPNGEITRAEAAALIYRAVTGDTDDSDVGMFADNVFTDVTVNAWYSGYVNYCANHGIIRGHDDGSFKPMDPVTGYQAMAMILRAIGYNSYNEFTGDLWQEETAEYGTLTGISNTVTNAALRKNASRAMVGELLFRGITQTSTVQYNALYKYSNTNQTKGWEIFGLTGQNDAANANAALGYVGTNAIKKYDSAQAREESALGYDASNDLVAMTNRAAPMANLTRYDVRYGEPVAFWYRDVNWDGINTVTIPVYYDPIKTYTVGVADDVLFADFGVNDGGTGSNQNTLTHYAEDGLAKAAVLNRAAAASTDVYGGKGTLLELYKVTDKGATYDFLVEKNTYTARVTTTYLASATGMDRGLGLGITAGTDVETVDYGTYAYNGDTSDQRKATLSGVSGIVTYNKYDDGGNGAGTMYADHTTIKAAKSENITVTWTYDAGTSTAGAGTAADLALNSATTAANSISWFTANGKNYEYNHLFTSSILPSAILNRDEGSWDDVVGNRGTNFNRNQTVYTDQYGYVVHVTNSAAGASETGWVVLTNAVFNNYRYDNGYVLQLTGYNAKGEPISWNGAIDGANDGVLTYAYGSTQSAASAVANFEMGIFHYTFNAGTGLYSLQDMNDTSNGMVLPGTILTGLDPSAGVYDGGNTVNQTKAALPETDILAGEADSLHETKVVHDNTVFVIANYNDYGFITGYNVVKGFKRIPDLFDAQNRNAMGDPWIATADVEYAVEWVDTSAATAALDNIDLVFIRGARQADDTIGTAVADNTFYLLDPIPQDFVVTYDLHPVIMNGQTTNLKFRPDFVSDMTTGPNVALNGGFEGLNSQVGFYTINTTGGAERWVTSVVDPSLTTLGNLQYVAPGVLSYGGTFVAMADNCQVYRIDISAQSCTPLTAAQIEALNVTATGNTGALVTARDVYGFATTVYVVVA